MVDQNWLVTGGCGFIGKRLVAKLIQDETASIRILDDCSVGSLDDLRRAVPSPIDECDASVPAPPRPGIPQFVRGNIVDNALTRRAMEGMTTVVHLAANTGVALSVDDPMKDCTVNVLGTLNLLEAARANRVARFVFASSGAPLGEVTPPIHEELAPHPVSPYGASKLAGEAYCSAYARTFGIGTVALRFGNVYGPGSGHKSSAIAKFIRDAVETGTLTIDGDGSQTRDFIYVDDLIAATLLAARRPDIAGETFQIATQRETSVREVAEVICKALPRFGIPVPRLKSAPNRVGDVRRNFSDTSKALKRLGWSATTELREGVSKTIEAFIESKPKPSKV